MVLVEPARKTAVVAGAFFLLTEVAAIAGLALYDPVLHDTHYILGPGADTRVFLGALFEIVLAAAVIGTGVVLFPVLKKQNEGAALGYVCARLLEAAVIIVGIISVLSLVKLRKAFEGAADSDTASLLRIGKTLVAIHDWTFLIGPNFILGANSLILAWLMYRAKLVPRSIAVLGLAGGALICTSATAVMFGLYEQISVAGSIAAIPVFTWEVALAAWLITKGCKPAAPLHKDNNNRTTPHPTTI
ncbi:DUF4386 domain-containing protein [Streptomyces sp. V1I6]|uniref:DUF4386 domain-containing protein n=1 Tax=Streptomyces sp. V1I6 TaxID=3042273 RepID=UPI0027D8082A|nr:DUF4386 domain-containing protein [Streptomyces sp. V1I6]